MNRKKKETRKPEKRLFQKKTKVRAGAIMDSLLQGKKP